MKKSNGEGTIYYSNSKNCYIGQISLGKDSKGKLIRKTIYAKTRNDIYNKMIDIQSKNNVGAFADDKGYTLSKWIDKWFSTYKIHDYKQGTYEKEFKRSDRIKNDIIGSKHLLEIKPVDVQQFINNLSNELSHKSIRNIMILLNGAMKQALAEGYILTNPCDRVSLPKMQKTDMVALNKREKDIFLSNAEDSAYYDIFLFALNTGMRISEICGLTRNNVDFSNGYITVSQQLVRIKGDLILDTPKTKQSIRKVPLNETSTRILKKYMYGDYTRLDYVFFNPNTHNQLVQNTLSMNCRKVLDKCYEQTHNEVFKKANFHSLRHTFATQWLIQGGNVALLSKVLGHTDTSFTMRVYVQPSNEDIKEEMLGLVF